VALPTDGEGLSVGAAVGVGVGVGVGPLVDGDGLVEGDSDGDGLVLADGLWLGLVEGPSGPSVGNSDCAGELASAVTALVGNSWGCGASPSPPSELQSVAPASAATAINARTPTMRPPLCSGPGSFAICPG